MGLVGVGSLAVGSTVWLSAGNDLLPMYWSSLKSRMYGVGRIVLDAKIPFQAALQAALLLSHVLLMVVFLKVCSCVDGESKNWYLSPTVSHSPCCKYVSTD